LPVTSVLRIAGYQKSQRNPASLSTTVSHEAGAPASTKDRAVSLIFNLPQPLFGPP
jgi:hypothetical protein